jgi:hypothetical protein
VQNFDPEMFPRQNPPFEGKRNNDFSSPPTPPFPDVPAATAAPTNEKALNSPLEEEEVACKEGATESRDVAEGREPEGEEAERKSQGSVETAKLGLVMLLNDLDEDMLT